MTDTLPSAAVGRELGGCPVMHRDFSRAQAAGCHWEQADELRESSPLYFNTFAQGYWVFTRYDAVRDMYKTRDLFSSASITPWEPDPIYRFVPTQIDPPDHIQYRRILNPWFAPRAVDAAAAPPPDRGVPEHDRDRPRRRGHLRSVGRGLLRRLRRRSRLRRGHGRGARGHPRILGRRAGGAPRRAGAAAGRPRGTPAPRNLRRASPHGRRDAGHADRPRPRRTGHDARRARLHVPTPRRPPRAPPGA